MKNDLKLPFNPIKRAEEVEKMVMQGLKRKYYRFRHARYYGGIATLDAVGCCLLCAYCWNYFRNLNPEKYGKFYSAREACEKVLRIVERKGVNKVRVSGAEPILGKKSFRHLVNLIELVLDKKPEITFILETNGIILGYREKFCERLANYPILVRVSLKGWDEKSFELISGAEGKFFEFPLIALKNLRDYGVEAWPAIMHEIFGKEGREKIRKKLEKFGIGEIEEEYLEAYPFVIKNLKERGIKVKS